MTKYSYLIGYLFTGPKGALCHGDFTFTLDRFLVAEDVEIVRQHIKTLLRNQSLLGATVPGEENLSIISLCPLFLNPTV